MLPDTAAGEAALFLQAEFRTNSSHTCLPEGC